MTMFRFKSAEKLNAADVFILAAIAAFASIVILVC